MDQFTSGHTLGVYLFSLFLVLVVYWIARRQKFFRLPPSNGPYPIKLSQTIGAFLVYLLFAFLILPLVQVVLALVLTGELNGIKQLVGPWMGWINFIALSVLFFLLIGYCYFIDAQTRRFIFWGEKEVSVSRFFKSFGMGLVGWIVSYPFVLFVSLITTTLSLWIWGDVEVEQVAVKQLKTTMDSPVLYGFMIFAVVVLVPFMEELLFRGFFQNLLKRFLGRVWAIILTACIFALVHFAPSQGVGNFQLIISLGVLSFFLGFIYEREGTLWAPLALHMIFNGSSVLFISLS